MEDVKACTALDEAIGQTSQGYQKWGHAARESKDLKIPLVAPSGISVSSDSSKKFHWQSEPNDKLSLKQSLKPNALEPEQKYIKKQTN